MRKVAYYFKSFFALVTSGQGRVVLPFMVVLLCGCDRVGEQKPEHQIDKTTLGIGSGLFLSPVWIAENRGYFREEGLDVTIKTFSTGKASLHAMLEGAVDISTSAAFPIMLSSFARQDFSIFATLASSDTNVKVIARKDSGITTIEDLRGKRIGTPSSTSAQFFLASLLMSHKIPKSDIIEIDLRPPDLLTAFDKSQLDAILIWEPFADEARQLLEHNSVILPVKSMFEETFNLLTMNDYAGSNPDVLKKILCALVKATAFIRNQKAESIDIVTQNVKMNREKINRLWDEYNFAVCLKQSLLITLEYEARWAINNNLTATRNVPNYLHYLSLGPLGEVNPKAVTIIR